MPRPNSIPHLTSQNSTGAAPQSTSATTGLPTLHPTTSTGGVSGSPVKEPSVLQRGMSVDEQDGEEIAKHVARSSGSDSKGVPIRH